MRIFLKIFLSFWITVIAVGGAVAWVAYQFRGEMEALMREEWDDRLAERDRLREVLIRDGVAALRRALEVSPQREHIYVAQRGGGELLGRTVPSHLLRHDEPPPPPPPPPPPRGEHGGRDGGGFDRGQGRPPVAGEAPPGPPPEPPPGPPDDHGPGPIGSLFFGGSPRMEPPSLRERLRSAPVRLDDGRVYRLWTAPPRPPPGRVPAAFAVPLLVAVGVSGLLVLLLARHFSAPVRRLRRAAGRFADGELGARVGGVRRWVPDELSELAGEFDRMAERTEGLVGSHKRLLRDVSHELRSPLARLRVALGLLERKSPEAAGELERMEREVERLDELIGQVLTLARLDGGEPPARESLIELAGLVAQVVEDAAFESGDGGPPVRLERRCEAPLMADVALLHSALDNLVRNALRHSPAGEAVTVAMECGDGWVAVVVRDRGPGVPEADLERIFEPFVRVGEARDRESGGHGVGLAIAARAVRAHGGTLGAANHPDGGLAVTLRLPVEAVASVEE
ncbi:ATP-binding protein [Endothiovibrio diazotrophicus]